MKKTLEQCLNRHFGGHRSIAELRRTPSAYRSSFAIEDLEVRFDDGTEINLVFKNLNRDSLAVEARGVKPAFLYDPLR